MELLQLKYFCEAAKNENFSETAKKFYVPTSNISSSIKRLEKELGYELFNHASNKITLNENGKIFYENVAKAMLYLNNAKVQLSDKYENLNGRINIRCKSNRRAVMKTVEKFIKVHPDVKFNVTFGEAQMNDIDLIISYDVPIEFKEKVLLTEEDISIAMKRSHPLAGKSDLCISDLKGEKFITGLSIETHRACNDAGFYPNIAFQLNDPSYVRRYVEMGLGIALVPSYSWRGLFSENIVLKKTGMIRKTYAFIPPNRYTKRAVTAFVEMLKEETANAR